MLFVVAIVACIPTTVLPHVVTEAMHDSVLETTFEVAPISPLEASITAHLIIDPVASVLGAISPEVDT